MVPPVEEMFDGPGSLKEFKANGEEFLNIYKEICQLQRDEKMLVVEFGMIAVRSEGLRGLQGLLHALGETVGSHDTCEIVPHPFAGCIP